MTALHTLTTLSTKKSTCQVIYGNKGPNYYFGALLYNLDKPIKYGYFFSNIFTRINGNYSNVTGRFLNNCFYNHRVGNVFDNCYDDRDF